MAVIKKQRPPTAPSRGPTGTAPAPAPTSAAAPQGDPLARALLAVAVTGRAVAKSIADLARSLDGLAEAVRQTQTGGKGAPRSNIVDSPYNTSGPWSTAQGGGKSWMGQVK
jgi:hypothetical protein